MVRARGRPALKTLAGRWPNGGDPVATARWRSAAGDTESTIIHSPKNGKADVVLCFDALACGREDAAVRHNLVLPSIARRWPMLG